MNERGHAGDSTRGAGEHLQDWGLPLSVEGSDALARLLPLLGQRVWDARMMPSVPGPE